MIKKIQMIINPFLPEVGEEVEAKKIRTRLGKLDLIQRNFDRIAEDQDNFKVIEIDDELSIGKEGDKIYLRKDYHDPEIFVTGKQLHEADDETITKIADHIKKSIPEDEGKNPFLPDLD